MRSRITPQSAVPIIPQSTNGVNEMTDTLEPVLWLNDARGIYIPRDFANSFADRAKHVANVSDETWAILESGPDHEAYWDAWADVTDNARVTDKHGNVFTVYQDGDCWLIPLGMEWDDANDWFIWPDRGPPYDAATATGMYDHD
jgi:hypothetical protein